MLRNKPISQVHDYSVNSYTLRHKYYIIVHIELLVLREPLGCCIGESKGKRKKGKEEGGGEGEEEEGGGRKEREGGGRREREGGGREGKEGGGRREGEEEGEGGREKRRGGGKVRSSIACH